MTESKTYNTALSAVKGLILAAAAIKIDYSGYFSLFRFHAICRLPLRQPIWWLIWACELLFKCCESEPWFLTCWLSDVREKLNAFHFSPAESKTYLRRDPNAGRAAQHGEGGYPRLVLQSEAKGETHQPVQQHHPPVAQPDLTCCDTQSLLLQPTHSTVYLILYRLYRDLTVDLLFIWVINDRKGWFFFPPFFSLSRYQVTVCPRSPPASAQQVRCNYCLRLCRVLSINN